MLQKSRQTQLYLNEMDVHAQLFENWIWIVLYIVLIAYFEEKRNRNMSETQITHSHAYTYDDDADHRFEIRRKRRMVFTMRASELRYILYIYHIICFHYINFEKHRTCDKHHSFVYLLKLMYLYSCVAYC